MPDQLYRVYLQRERQYGERRTIITRYIVLASSCEQAEQLARDHYGASWIEESFSFAYEDTVVRMDTATYSREELATLRHNIANFQAV